MKLKVVKKAKPLKADVKQVDTVASMFQLKLQNRFEALRNESPSIKYLTEAIV